MVIQSFGQIPFSNVTTAQRLGILGRTLGYVRFSTDDFRWNILKSSLTSPTWQNPRQLLSSRLRLKQFTHSAQRLHRWWTDPDPCQQSAPLKICSIRTSHLMDWREGCSSPGAQRLYLCFLFCLCLVPVPQVFCACFLCFSVFCARCAEMFNITNLSLGGRHFQSN